MRLRLPLSVKILLWFFLNFAALAVVFVLLFNAQFHFNLDWLLTGSARANVERLRDTIAFDLNNSPPDQWDSIVEHHSTVNEVRLTVYDDDGDRLIGPEINLPKEIEARLFPPQRQRPGENPEGQPSPTPSPEGAAASAPANSPAPAASTPPPSRPPEGRRPFWWRGGRMDLVRTTNPTHYWLLTGMRIENPEAGFPIRAVLIADDSSFTMGGQLVNLGPWWKLGLGALAFTILFWFPLLWGITRSIGKLNQATKRIAEGRFDARVSSRRRDELGVLAESINQMAARLDGFVKGQKRFLGDVAHELCSPLARLQMALGIIEQNANEKQLAYAKTATEKAGQISTLVNALLDFSKASFEAQSVHLGLVDVKAVVEKALTLEAVTAEGATLDIPAGLTACADPELLTRALANLIRNAILHNDKCGKIIITAVKNGHEAAISVADCGTGIPEAELPKIFDAFYRLDTSRARETGGVGLGLTIVKTCVESCHGAVTARNRHPHGLEVIITLHAECPPKQG